MVACLVTGPRISDARSLSARARRARPPRASRRLAAVAEGSIRFISFVRTSPAPASRKVVAPAAARARIPVSHRTGETTWRSRSSRSLSAVRDELARDVLRHRDRRIPYLDPIEGLAHGLDRRPHQLAVEGPRHGEADRRGPCALSRPPPAARSRPPIRSRRSGRGSSRSPRRGRPSPRTSCAEGRRVVGAETQERAHRPRSLLAGALHRRPADHDQRERVGEPHRVRRDERRELTERMPCDADDVVEPFGDEHPERRDVAGEQRRLDERGRGQGLVVPRAVDHVAPDRRRGLRQHGGAGRVPRPGIGHPRELRSLPREQHRRRHGRQA